MIMSLGARLGGALALLGLPGVAWAASLSIVTVNAPAINCVYETDCTITVTDSVGTIPIPNLTAGVARLQSRTFVGQPGAPAAGKTGYEYRVDLTTAVTNAEFSCVTDLAVDFGAVTKLQYNNAGPVDDVYVVTQGGLGKIGLLFAEQVGSVITFTFSQPVCAGQTPNSGDTTFFFGLTSAFAPHAITAKVGVPGLLPVDVKARGPNHPRIPIVVLDKPLLQPAAQQSGAAQPVTQAEAAPPWAEKSTTKEAVPPAAATGSTPARSEEPPSDTRLDRPAR